MIDTALGVITGLVIIEAYPTDLASSGVCANVMLCKTPTFDGVYGILFFIILLVI